MKRCFKTMFLSIVAALMLSVAGHSQGKPDLVVSDLRVEPDPTGRFIGRVAVTVANVCPASESAQSFVMVTFKESDRPDAKAFYFVSSRLRSLKGGGSQIVRFDSATSGKQVGLASHVVAEADPYKKVSEADEQNNWRTINPPSAGVPVDRSQCR